MTVTVSVLIVSGSISSSKVAVTFLLNATPVASSSGSVELTVGAVTSDVDPVVKLQTTSSARALPAASVAPVEIVVV